MKRHRSLFEKHQQGTLDDRGVEELDQLLVDMYFQEPGELNPPELEYAEDVIIDLCATNKLKEEYLVLFRKNLTVNKTLTRKFRLLEQLKSGSEQTREHQLSQLMANENPELEKQEEEQLSRIVREAIEKVHQEAQTSRSESFLARLPGQIASFIDSLLPRVPNLKPVLAIAGILLIAAIVWISVRPGQKPMISKLTEKDSLKEQVTKGGDTLKNKTFETIKQLPVRQKDEQLADADSVKRLPGKDYKAPQRKHIINKPSVVSPELDKTLLAYAEDIPDELAYMQVRSETTEGYDLYADAADSYNTQDYTAAARLMNKILRGRYFTSADTLTTLNFYLGNSYFALGFEKPSPVLLRLALTYYSKVSGSSGYYNDARWFTALIYARIGEKSKGVKVLDDLLHDKYLRSGNVLKFKQLLTGQ